MLIKKLETRNYRNLTGTLPPLSDGINVLCGQNAAGKTNTLEAMFLFACAKSFRTSREKELISRGAESADVQMTLQKGANLRHMSVNYTGNGASVTKHMSVDGFAVQKTSEFLGIFRAVLFTPDHLNLVKGGPEERRKLTDLALCQIRPRYVSALNEYEKVLSQRNAYLKKLKISGTAPDKDYITVLSEQLSDAAAVVARQRCMFCDKLSEIAGNMYSQLTGEKEKLCVKYSGFAETQNLYDEKTASKILCGVYEKSLQSDLSLGRTFHGPHRDELMIYIAKDERAASATLNPDKTDDDGKLARLTEWAARSFGSQGQQRSAVLAIKLAEGEIIKELTGEYPVFLLDDLFSELDSERRERLSELLSGKQTVITCCDVSHLPKNAGLNLIHVENGRYKQAL